MEGKEQVVISYLDMPEHKLPEVLADDAAKWAYAFCEHAASIGINLDEGWMTIWFANAIEASWDARTRRAQLPTEPAPTVIK